MLLAGVLLLLRGDGRAGLPRLRSVSGAGGSTGRRYGGMDFGLRNPVAPVWCVLDRDDNFWLTGEHHAQEQPLVHHARHLPLG